MTATEKNIFYIKKSIREGFEKMDYYLLRCQCRHAAEKHFEETQEDIEKRIAFQKLDSEEKYGKHGRVFFTTIDDPESKKVSLTKRIFDQLAADDTISSYLAKWICKEAIVRDSMFFDIRDFEGEDAEPIGYQIKKGEVIPVYMYTIAVQTKGSDYKNRITLLPFDIVTIFPHDEDQTDCEDERITRD